MQTDRKIVGSDRFGKPVWRALNGEADSQGFSFCRGGLLLTVIADAPIRLPAGRRLIPGHLLTDASTERGTRRP